MDLEDSMKRTRNKQTELVNRLKSENSNAKNYINDIIDALRDDGRVKIPTATLRELFIFNEAYVRRKEIRHHLDDDLTKSISSIFSKFQDKTHTKKSDEALEAEQKKKAWLSRCLVLILDTENRLILIGSTQPTCHESGLFRQAVSTITNLRVGEEFAEVMDSCSKEFVDRTLKMTKSQNIEDGVQLSNMEASEIEGLKLHDQVVNEDKSKWHQRIPAPTEDKWISSWACERSTFEFKPPFLRCQSMYPRWLLHQRPTDKEKRKEDLVQWVFSHLVPHKPSLEMDWAYFAETAVASKLYLLQNGTFCLV